MEKKQNLLKKLFAAAALVAAALWAFVIYRKKSPAEQLAQIEKKAAEAGEKEAQKERDKIEKTDAGDLLNASPHATDLRAGSAEITAEFRDRAGDRIRKILQRKDGN